MSSMCWLDTTTVSTATGAAPWYWIVTCTLPSGRR